MVVTRVSNGAATYTGTPNAANFGVVFIGNGDDWSVDMPATGQTSIYNAATSGPTGVIFTEWSSFAIYPNENRYTILAPLLLAKYGGSDSRGVAQTFTSLVSHPIWTGLPNSFTTNYATSCSLFASINSQATEIAKCGAYASNSGIYVLAPTSGPIKGQPFLRRPCVSQFDACLCDM